VVSCAGGLKVFNHTQQLFNSGHRQGNGADRPGIECPVGGTDGHQALDVWEQPNDATTTEIGFVGDADQG
jgi:hypothetical protein